MQWLVDWQDAMPGEAAESLALLLQTTHDEAFELGCASPCGHPATPPQDTARHMWLLGGASSAGRTNIPVEQYEELRALAAKLAHDAKQSPLVKTLYYIEDAEGTQRGPFMEYQQAADNCRTHKAERVVERQARTEEPHDEEHCINCNSNAKPKETSR